MSLMPNHYLMKLYTYTLYVLLSYFILLLFFAQSAEGFLFLCEIENVSWPI